MMQVWAMPTSYFCSFSIVLGKTVGVELESMTSRSIRRASKKRDLGLGTMNKVIVEKRERDTDIVRILR